MSRHAILRLQRKGGIAMRGIDFWFSIGSTYSYLTITRLASVEAAEGVPFAWRPFNVRSIMLEQDNIPFAKKPVKAAYMWRDIARRAASRGLRPRLPAPYPIEHLPLANQVALVGAREGWCRDYVVETYRRWFEAGDPPGSEPNLSQSLAAIGQDPDGVIALAASDETVDALAAETRIARDLGIFGAPSFAVDGEVFWGDDRLEDAIAWRRHGRLPPVTG
jgi:2-hydroxychromene-2-carboxylate isomerase